jgi:hypothetical protein
MEELPTFFAETPPEKELLELKVEITLFVELQNESSRFDIL